MFANLSQIITAIITSLICQQ